MNGTRGFLGLRSPPLTTATTPRGNLLPTPISSLEKAAHLLAVAEIHKNQFGSSPAETAVVTIDPSSQLLVDKYSPKAFAHLLSSEQINREVLKALKQWDAYVFKTGTTASAAANNATAQSNHLLSADEDAPVVDCRPTQRVILLSGTLHYYTPLVYLAQLTHLSTCIAAASFRLATTI